jgi:hypothetical protein
LLRKHPDIYIHNKKELNLFSEDKDIQEEIKRYQTNVKYLGDASTEYSKWPFFSGVSRRIKHYCGSDIKIIYIVRHPIDRYESAISFYNWNWSKGNRWDEEFTDWTDKNNNFDPQKAIQEDGVFYWPSCYYTQLEMYLKYFSREQILVLKLEDPRLPSIYEFLGISPLPNGLPHVNIEPEQFKVRLTDAQRKHVWSTLRDDLTKFKELTGISWEGS